MVSSAEAASVLGHTSSAQSTGLHGSDGAMSNNHSNTDNQGMNDSIRIVEEIGLKI